MGLIEKICNLIKKIILGVTAAAIVHYLLKAALVALKYKYWAISFGYLILDIIKVWLHAKHAKHDDIEVHYEGQEHEYHHPETYSEDVTYEDGDNHHGYHHSKPWDRNTYAQNLAYRKQKPQSLLGSLFT